MAREEQSECLLKDVVCCHHHIASVLEKYMNMEHWRKDTVRGELKGLGEPPALVTLPNDVHATVYCKCLSLSVVRM
jgi:hypothetical protein